MISTRASTIQTEDDGVRWRHGPVSLVGLEVDWGLLRCCRHCCANGFVGAGSRSWISRSVLRSLALLDQQISAAATQWSCYCSDCQLTLTPRSDGVRSCQLQKRRAALLENDCHDFFAPALPRPGDCELGGGHKKHKAEERGVGSSSTDPSSCTPSTRHDTSRTSRRRASANERRRRSGRHYALVAAKDGRRRRAGGVRRPARGDQAAGHAPQDVGE